MAAERGAMAVLAATLDRPVPEGRPVPAGHMPATDEKALEPYNRGHRVERGFRFMKSGVE